MTVAGNWVTLRLAWDAHTTFTFAYSVGEQVLKEEGYTKQVDWWTIGTLLFEMLTGLPPFYDEDMQDMYQKILHKPLEFDENMSQDCKYDRRQKRLRKNLAARVHRKSGQARHQPREEKWRVATP